ncbi:MAG: hypothetical protein RLZZ248_859 [Bacteroidota bacterium]
MLHIKPFPFYLCMLLFLGACGPSKEEIANNAENATWAEMMKIHDEVMPKTSEIVSLYSELKEVDPQKIAANKLSLEVQETIILLEDAEEAMFAWMNALKNLKILRLQKNHEEIMIYLKQENQKIEFIRDQMLTALEEGYHIKNKLAL